MLYPLPWPRLAHKYPEAGWPAVAAVSFGSFMGQFDASIVLLTFPALQRQFSAPLAAVQWVSLSYLVVLMGLLAAAARMADAVGRKAIYLCGLGVFAAGSAACGLAPGLGWLIGFRAFQALGAAMLQANSIALIVTSMPRAKMRAALGVQAAVQALGLALGPAVGGWLIMAAGWRWVFLVNVPVGLVGMAAGGFLLRPARERTPFGRFDSPGMTLLVLASGAALLALSRLSGLGLPRWAATAAPLAAAAALAGFGWRESRTASPMLALSALKPAAVSLGLTGALCGYLVLFGPLALFPELLAGRAAATLVTACLPAGFAVAAVTTEWALPARVGQGHRAVSGALTSALGSIALMVTLPGSATADGALLLVVGFGMGMFIPANNASIMAALPVRLLATGGGLVNMARGFGTALGVCLVAVCLHADRGYGAGVTMGVLAGVSVLALLSSLAQPAAQPAPAQPAPAQPAPVQPALERPVPERPAAERLVLTQPARRARYHGRHR